ncbi:MAG: DUF3794 domain-containing protein [Ruthenibacterium sp.]
MELKVYQDTIAAAQSICDAKAELAIETELLIPDYLPQVFKIVKCIVSLVTLQKQVTATRLTVEGYLRITVFYQSDTEETLCQTEQKIPFTKQLEIASGNYFAPEINVTGETEYVNCRAVNQRRVDIRGAFALSIHASAQTGQEVITALADCGIEQKTVPLQSMQTVAVQEKLITAEESLHFEVLPEMVLSIVCSGVVSETKLMAGKAVLKGEIHAIVFYRTVPGHTVLQLEKQIPFHEIMEVEGADEGCTALAFADPTGCTLAASEDAAQNLSVTAVLSLKVYRTVQVLSVVDAFSTRYETEITTQDIVLEREAELFVREIEAVASGPVPDEDGVIVTAFAQAMPPEPLLQDGQIILRGRVFVQILCANVLGEIDCYDKVCEYTLPNGYHISPEEFSLTAQAQVLQVAAHKSGKDMSAAVLMRVKGIVTQKQKISVASSVICTDLRVPTAQNAALRIYYAQAGENLFDIAKQYAASPAEIAAANAVDAEQLAEKTQLLIPQIPFLTQNGKGGESDGSNTYL